MTALQEDIDWLAHYGAKGMKWGVRRNRRAELHKKVGAGKGTFTEKVRSGANVGIIDLAKGGGFKGGAKRKAARQIARNDRVKKGEASVKDKLAYYGGTRYQDIIPTGKSGKNTKAAVGASVAGAVLLTVGMNVISAGLKAKR